MKGSLVSALHHGSRRLPWRSGPRLGLAVSALILNGTMDGTAASTVLFLIAVVLIAVEGVSWKRLWPFSLALFSGIACVAAGWIAGGRADELLPLGARLLAGLAWMAWAGLTCRWPELRHLLERLRLRTAADTIESAMVHGDLLLGGLQRGREAVLVRQGRRSLRPRTVGILLANTFESAFGRAKSLDDARALRSGVPRAMDGDTAIELDKVSVAGCCGPARLMLVSMSVRRGEWLALAGPSGSGKTTLLKTAAGLIAPSTGQVRRFGTKVEGSYISARVDGRVSLVFQDPNDQILGATPVEDVAWGLRQRGMPRVDAEAKAKATLDAIGIGRLADRPIHHLSFGERKRVAFAAAFATGPAILLCDEPTMGLDPVAAANLVSALESAASPDTAVVWATHDLIALPRLTHRIVLLSAGEITFSGTRAEALSLDHLRRAGLAP